MTPNYHLLLAVVPLACYFLWRGILQLRQRPLLITSSSNTLALSLAIVGLAIVGPLPWLIPDHAIQKFGGMVWWMVLGLYLLITILILLLARPQLIVSNARMETIKPLVAEIMSRLDSQCTWAGNNIVLPQLGLELRIDTQPFFRVVTLTNLGQTANIQAWQMLFQELKTAIRTIRVPINPWGPLFIAMSVVLLGWQCYTHYQHWQEIRFDDFIAEMQQTFKQLIAM